MSFTLRGLRLSTIKQLLFDVFGSLMAITARINFEPFYQIFVKKVISKLKLEINRTMFGFHSSHRR